jgi:hypothetical protein
VLLEALDLLKEPLAPIVPRQGVIRLWTAMHLILPHSFDLNVRFNVYTETSEMPVQSPIKQSRKNQDPRAAVNMRAVEGPRHTIAQRVTQVISSEEPLAQLRRLGHATVKILASAT